MKSSVCEDRRWYNKIMLITQWTSKTWVFLDNSQFSLTTCQGAGGDLEDRRQSQSSKTFNDDSSLVANNWRAIDSNGTLKTSQPFHNRDKLPSLKSNLYLKGSFTIFLFSVRTHILDSNEVWYSWFWSEGSINALKPKFLGFYFVPTVGAAIRGTPLMRDLVSRRQGPRIAPPGPRIAPPGLGTK